MPDTYRRAATLEALRLHAAILAHIRAFFAARDVLEVETPSLSPAAVTDPALHSITAQVERLGGIHYLHTSPEFAMKRLLAAGAGDIYQICRVYRDGELGRWHEPEFTLLEWYRVGWDDSRLMTEVAELVHSVLGSERRDWPVERLPYRDAFMRATGLDPVAGSDPVPSPGTQQVLPACEAGPTDSGGGGSGASARVPPSRKAGSTDPHGDSTADSAIGHPPNRYAGSDFRTSLSTTLAEQGIDVPPALEGNTLLDLAFSTLVVPSLRHDALTFICDYPADQAALAKLKPGHPPVAARFELFAQGIELANGFAELTDPNEQRQRFTADQAARRCMGLPEMPIDESFLAALDSGLPESAGVALGVDRLIALAAGATSIAEILAFTHRRD